MKTKVIYVAGLYHTGSTLLDMILGNLPNVIGLGEIFKGFHDRFEEVCSCGQKVENCDFWGEIISQINVDESMDMRKKYELVLSTFSKKYGNENILVDSSICHPFKVFSSRDERDMQGLNHLIFMDNIELKVIHLVRDVRSWSNSIIARDKRGMNDLGLKSRLFMFFFRSPTARFLQWFWGHKKIISFLKKNKVDNILITYEDLAIHPESTLRELTDFLDIEYKSSMLSPKDSNSHIAVGNPVRHKEKEMNRIRYDYRWFSSMKLFFPSLILWPIMRFNKRIMYKK